MESSNRLAVGEEGGCPGQAKGGIAAGFPRVTESEATCNEMGSWSSQGLPAVQRRQLRPGEGKEFDQGPTVPQLSGREGRAPKGSFYAPLVQGARKHPNPDFSFSSRRSTGT